MEMRHLQELYEKFKDKGLVVLGFNWADNKMIARKFIQENNVTFPYIVDSSDAATKTCFEDYKSSGVIPTNYIIDRQGKVVDGWFGEYEVVKKATAILEKLGIK